MEELIAALEPRHGETPIETVARLRYDREQMLAYRRMHPKDCRCDICRMVDSAEPRVGL